MVENNRIEMEEIKLNDKIQLLICRAIDHRCSKMEQPVVRLWNTGWTSSIVDEHGVSALL